MEISSSQNITERDIFNFVFESDKLTSSKRNEISDNKYYINKIELYKKLKSSLKKNILSEVKSKIASVIPAYKENNNNKRSVRKTKKAIDENLAEADV